MRVARSESEDQFRFLNNAFVSFLIRFEEASCHDRIQSFSERYRDQALHRICARFDILEVFEESSKSENEIVSCVQSRSDLHATIHVEDVEYFPLFQLTKQSHSIECRCARCFEFQRLHHDVIHLSHIALVVLKQTSSECSDVIEIVKHLLQLDSSVSFNSIRRVIYLVAFQINHVLRHAQSHFVSSQTRNIQQSVEDRRKIIYSQQSFHLLSLILRQTRSSSSRCERLETVLTNLAIYFTVD